MHTTYKFKATLKRGSRIRTGTGIVKSKIANPITLDDAMLVVFALLKEDANRGFESIHLSINPKDSSVKSA